MAINLNNLNAAFSKAADSVSELNSVSHQELVSIEDIVIAEFNPYNENDSDDNVEQLAKSIESYGLIEPLCVNKDKDGKYHLISGERRFKAILRLKWKRVPCVVYDGLEAVQAELRLHEANLETREYTAAQKFSFYKRVRELLLKLKDEGKLTGGLQKNIANMLHISERQVRKYDSISELPQDIQKSVEDGTLSINAAYDISQSYDGNNSTSDEDKTTDEAQSNDEEALDNNAEEEPEEAETISDSDSKAENQSSVIQSTENIESSFDYREWQKHLEKAILMFYKSQKLMKYYLLNQPTPQEAAKEFLKPDNGYSGYSNFPYNIVATSRLFQVTFRHNKKEFKYSEVDSCIRDMLRSGRLLEKVKHQKIAKFINELLEDC
ncbi:MAG: ParB/RepB/Spo0J family partition protein [Acutalibacteraceae bacterium]